MLLYFYLFFFLVRMETLKRHLPVSGQEGLSELRKIAVRFEEKIFTAATSQVFLLALLLFKSRIVIYVYPIFY